MSEQLQPKWGKREGRKVIYTFHSFIQWVNKAATRIGGTGAVCYDAKGRLCQCGADFQRARG